MRVINDYDDDNDGDDERVINGYDDERKKIKTIK